MKGTVWHSHIGFMGWLLRPIAWIVIHTVQRPKFHGPVPKLDKPAIFACRHVGMMDPVVLMSAYPWDVIHPLTAMDHVEKNWFTRWFFKSAQCISIDRHNGSMEWLDQSLEVMKRGESIIIFPEGKRNRTGDGLMMFHSGVALLAAKSGAPVIPVWNEQWQFPHRYRLAVGEAFYIDPVPETGITTEWLHSQADKVHDAVAGLKARIPERNKQGYK